jgi:hypothetical protein
MPSGQRVLQSRTWIPALIGVVLISIPLIYFLNVVTGQEEIYSDGGSIAVIGGSLVLGILFGFIEFRRRKRVIALVPCRKGMAIYETGKLVYEAHLGELVTIKLDLVLTVIWSFMALCIPVAMVIAAVNNEKSIGDIILAIAGACLAGAILGSVAWSRIMWNHLRVPVKDGKSREISVSRALYNRLWPHD